MHRITMRFTRFTNTIRLECPSLHSTYALCSPLSDHTLVGIVMTGYAGQIGDLESISGSRLRLSSENVLMVIGPKEEDIGESWPQTLGGTSYHSEYLSLGV